MRPRFDPRLTPARPDLAAAHLEGTIEADRYVTGRRMVIVGDVADVRRQPRPDAPLDTQALAGEMVVLYDEDEGWGWVQLETDGYVGYMPMHALGARAAAPTHVVTVKRTFVYPGPDIKQPIIAALPLGARIAVERAAGDFLQTAGGQSTGQGFVFAAHVESLDTSAPRARSESDFVSVAERLLAVPYLWGGKSPLGIDCSGLVQLSLACTGTIVPRDTDLQERAIGTIVNERNDLEGLRRGDLVFWTGHVGIMQDSSVLLHANAHDMLVACEPLRRAADRIFGKNGAMVTSVRRMTGF